jgi:hypothetical protein
MLTCVGARKSREEILPRSVSVIALNQQLVFGFVVEFRSQSAAIDVSARHFLFLSPRRGSFSSIRREKNMPHVAGDTKQKHEVMRRDIGAELPQRTTTVESFKSRVAPR